MPSAQLFALAAIALWGTLALLSVRLAAVPPLLLVAVALLIGSVCGLPYWRQWKVPLKTLALGCYGLFGYHFALIMAFRHAPAIEANLINYLWPLLIVLLSPLLLPGTRLGARHVLGGLLGLAGCVLVFAGRGLSLGGGQALGYGLALAAAVMWSSYSLLTRRVAPFPTGAIGGFCLVSGLMALAAHLALEPSYRPSGEEWTMLLVLGLGPMGAAFFLWDAALKRGDPRSIGTLAYLTPLLSTGLLALFGGGRLGLGSAAALALILAGAWLGRDRRDAVASAG